jgi:hypothetical protein
MASVTFRDFIYDDLGVGVGGIRARAFAKTAVNTRAGTHLVEDFSDSGTGMWELTVDTDNSPTGIFTIELYNPSTEQVRWRDGHIRLQVEALIGPGNTLPFPDLSVTSNKLADGSVTIGKITDGTLTSAKLTTADRTIDQNIATAMANTGTLPQLFSWIAKQIKNITGAADWKTSPATTLAAAYAHMISTANPHATTAAQAGAVANAGSSVSWKSGTDAAKGTGTQGAFYYATDTNKIYRHSGSAWVQIATMSYADLTNKPSVASNESEDFGVIQFRTGLNGVLGTLFADDLGDTVIFKEGSGIAFTVDTNNDTVTISADIDSTPAAHTHTGTSVTSAVNDSTRLGNVHGSQFPQFTTNTHFANSGATIGSTDIKMHVGSVLVNVVAGLGEVNLPFTVVGYAGIIACNGDYDAYNNAINLKDSEAGSDANFTIKTATSVTQTVRVNYMVAYW